MNTCTTAGTHKATYGTNAQGWRAAEADYQLAITMETLAFQDYMAAGRYPHQTGAYALYLKAMQDRQAAFDRYIAAR